MSQCTVCGHGGEGGRQQTDECREVNRIAELLMAEWQRAEKKKWVTISYTYTFVDMAMVVVADRQRTTTTSASPLINSIEDLRKANLQSWQEFEAVKLGTEAQQAAYSRQALPEVELLKIVRDELFKGFKNCARWTPIRESEVVHHTTCTANPRLMVVISARPGDTRKMGPDYWPGFEPFMKMGEHAWLAAAKAMPIAEIRDHIARCSYCNATVTSSSVLVKVPWAGRLLSREYACD